MPKPACLRCKCFYRVLTNGVTVVEGMPVPVAGELQIRNNEDIRGLRKPGAWQPYKIWSADLWECPDCGHQLISGWGQQPQAERHHDGFGEQVIREVTRDEHGRGYVINDCPSPNAACCACPKPPAWAVTGLDWDLETRQPTRWWVKKRVWRWWIPHRRRDWAQWWENTIGWLHEDGTVNMLGKPRDFTSEAEAKAEVDRRNAEGT